MSIRHFGILFVFGSIVLTVIACSPAARQRAGTIARGAATGAAEALPSQQYLAKLMIFGGIDHKSYLGCLSCNEYASDSVFNSYGSNGSAYSGQSIWNHYSEF